MNKRILSLALAGVLSLGLLTACGGSQTPAPETDTPAVESPTGTPETEPTPTPEETGLPETTPPALAWTVGTSQETSPTSVEPGLTLFVWLKGIRKSFKGFLPLSDSFAISFWRAGSS